MEPSCGRGELMPKPQTLLGSPFFYIHPSFTNYLTKPVFPNKVLCLQILAWLHRGQRRNMTNVGVKILSSVIFQKQDLISCQPRLCSQTETSRGSSCWFSFTGRKINHAWISNAIHTEVREKKLLHRSISWCGSHSFYVLYLESHFKQHCTSGFCLLHALLD